MKNSETKKNILQIAIISALIFVFALFGVVEPARIAYALESQYTDVLDDLQKDAKFDASNYPMDIKDYSLQLIQIAEGVDGDVFVYVYQPSADAKNYHASSINVSLSINNALSPRNYKLEYCNSNGVFFKYKILDLKVSDSNLRYYTIVSIFRPFDETVDEKAGGDNTITEVAFGISRQYTFGTVNGEPYVECVDIDTIEITDKFVGFVRCPSGFNLGALHYSNNVDSHFVAFNTDKPMDKLLEASVTYVTQDVEFTVQDKGSYVIPYNLEIGSAVSRYKELCYTDTYIGESHGLFYKNSYSWDRIQTIDEFFNSVESDQAIYSGAVLSVNASTEITNDALNNLKNKKWVLRFAETEFSQKRWHSIGLTSTKIYESVNFTDLGEVSILRLKFETEGKTYNLGAVDNKQTGSKDPINPGGQKLSITLTEKGKEALNYILWILLAILLVVLFAPVIPYIFKLIALPFKRVGKSVGNYNKRKREKRKAKREKQKKPKREKKPRKVKTPKVKNKTNKHTATKVGRRKHGKSKEQQ